MGRVDISRFASTLIVALLAVSVGAQEKPAQASERELILKGEDVTKKGVGLEVKLLKSVGGKWKLVDPRSEKFVECDQFTVQFWSNIEGFVYFVNITPGGETRIIYRKQIAKNTDYTLPDGVSAKEYRTEYAGRCAGKKPAGAEKTESDNFIWLDDEVGTETLKLVMTATPIAEFDRAYEVAKGVLEPSVVKPPQEQIVAGGPCFRGLQVKCRSLGFDAPKVSQGKGTFVVAIAEPKYAGALPQINKDEAIVFDLLLQHVKRQ